jgi:signal transduction histidine kinase
MVAAVAVAALLAGLGVVDRLGEAAIAREQAANAEAAADYFVAFAREEGAPALAAALDRHARLGLANGFRYAMIDDAGHMLAGADVVSSLDTPDVGWRTVVQPDTAQRRRWRVLARPLGQGRTLIVAEDLAARDGLRAAILGASGLALGLTLIGALAGGWWLQTALLGRTRTIAATAERIAEGDLSARAPVRARGDVFDDLASAVNAMLARIEELMSGMRTVTDSIAHDLRSPLTRMKGALARAADPATPEDTRLAAIDQAHAEVESVLATLSALLDIAQAETGLSREMMRRVDLGGVALEMAELFSPAIEDAGQDLTVDVPQAPLLVFGHPALLRQALGNLLHNAVVHAGPGAKVELTLAEQEAGVSLSVADSGHGVPGDQLGRVPERFVRLETARTSPGSGLGLSLVAACAKLHGGRLVLGDNAPGLRAVVELPSPEAMLHGGP